MSTDDCGARASDWADIQERTVRRVYEEVLTRTRVGLGTTYLDVGCGSGMAAQIAAARGAHVRCRRRAQACRGVRCDSPFDYADETTAVRGLNSAGVAVRAMENSSVEAVTEAHAKALAPFLQADGSYRIDATFRCLLAEPRITRVAHPRKIGGST